MTALMGPSRRLLAVATLMMLAAWSGPARAQLAPGEPTDQLVMSNWAGPFAGLTDLTFLSDGRAVAITKAGLIVTLKPDGTVLKMPAYTFPTLDVESEKGLLGIVRDQADRVYLYASTGTDVLDKHHVFRGSVAADGTVTLEPKPIESGGLWGPGNHDGGGLIIHKNQLFISVGDMGLNSSPPVNKAAQCLNLANGKILRINLDGTIPADNPLNSVVVATGCLNPTSGNYTPTPPDRRIYAWGLRNPWRFWIDPESDLLWIGDVGEWTMEEISVGEKGSNFGWPFREGTLVFSNPIGGLKDCDETTPSSACVAPQHTYPRGPVGAAIIGGLIPPRGCGWGAFERRYFFADYQKNLGWTVDVSADRRSIVADSVKPAFDIPAPVSIRLGPDGALYLMSAQGLVKKLAPKIIPAGCNPYAAPAPDGGADGPIEGVMDAGDALESNSETGGDGNTEAGMADLGGHRQDGAGGDGRDGGSPDVRASDADVDDEGCSCTLGRARTRGTSAGMVMLALLVLARVVHSQRRRARTARTTA
jgi:glucose/arabinose dehydrogenase